MSGPKPVTTPRATSLSRRAWAVPRATPIVRAMPTTLTRDLATFQARADALVREHPVVTSNAYTKWFATGTATRDDVRHLTVQFSVFSHQFLEAQLRRVFNARSLESYHAAKEI